MNRILPLVKKDLTHLWPQIVIFWVLMAIAAFFDFPGAVDGRSYVFIVRLLAMLSPLACWSLVIAVIHEECVIGDRQYWLTRPFTWRHLLGAKLLVVACATNLPLFLLQSASFLYWHLSPVTYFSDLLWRQVFFTAFFILPPAALGAITRNLGQAVAAVLGSLVLFVMFGSIELALSGGGSQGAGETGWIRACALAVIVIAGSTGILIIQYARRGAWLGRIVFAVTALSALVLVHFFTWERAFAIQSRLSTASISPSALRISFDPNGTSQPEIEMFQFGDGVNLAIPIRVAGLPNGAFLQINRLALHFAGQPLSLPVRGVPNAARRTLTVYLTATDFAKCKDVTGELRGALDLTLFVPAPSPGGWVSSKEGLVTAMPHTVLINRWASPRLMFDSPPGETAAPFPTSPWFDPVFRTWIPGDLDRDFDTFRPVAWFRRTIDFPSIRLSDYVVRPPVPHVEMFHPAPKTSAPSNHP
jgi:hypothetical protein